MKNENILTQNGKQYDLNNDHNAYALWKDSTMFNMSFAIYVPSTDGRDQSKANNEKQVERIATEFSKYFGGATITQGRGCYMDLKGNLVSEEVTIVKSYCHSDLGYTMATKAFVTRLAAELKIEMNQESVALEFNGDTLFLI